MAYEQVFISYHTGSSAETVHRICDILEQRGISCWYAPRNVMGDYATSIVDAIDRCRVFLVILNEEANLSEDVRNEINCAFERFRRHEDMTILPFRVDDSALSAAVKYYLGRIHIMNGSAPPEIMRIHELADRISVMLDTLPEKSGTVTDERNRVKRFYITGSVIYADGDFVGRTKELEALHKILSAPVNKAFLVGMGGMGKSEIAKTYCARFREGYDVIVWVPFEDSLEKTIRDDLIFPIEGMDRNDYPEDSDRAYFKRKLNILKQISDRRLLLVIDNYDVHQDPDLEEVCSGSYSVIFTTRYRNATSRIPEIEVSAISDPAEMMALFRIEYKRTGAAVGDIEALFDLLDGHPLSIRLVAAAMQTNRRLDARKMLEALTHSDLQVGSPGTKAGEVVFERLRTVFRSSDLKEEASAVLKVLALVPMMGIAVEELFDWCAWTDFEVIDDLIDKSWVVHDPISDEVHLHPIIARIFQKELEKDAGCCDAYVRRLIQITKVTKNYSWQRMQQLVKYCQTASTYLPDDHSLKLQLRIATASVLFDTQHYDESIEICRSLLEQTGDTETKLFLFHKLSHIQVVSGDAQGSLETARTGYAYLNTLDLDAMSLDAKYMKKVLLQRIGEASREVGCYDDAIAYGEKAVEVCDIYDFADPELSKGWALYHLARSLLCAGRLDDAQKELTKAEDLFEQIPDKWSVAFCYVLFGKILFKKEQYDMAMRYVSEAWDIHVHHYGSSSRLAANLLLDKGSILAAQGRQEEANTCFEDALAIYRSKNLLKQEQIALKMIAM